MSNKDIGDIYKSMLKGDKYVAPKRETELYTDVYTENTQEVKYAPGQHPNSIANQITSGGFNPRTGEQMGVRFAKDERLVKIKVSKNDHDVPPGEYYIPVDQITNFSTSGEDQQNVYAKIIGFLNAKNYNSKSFQQGHFTGLVHTILGQGDQGKKFVDYLSSSDQPSLIASLENGVGSLEMFAGAAGLPREALDQLMDSKWTDAGGSNVGPGEVALSLLFKDVRNKVKGTGAGDGGDLSITLEIGGIKGSMGTKESVFNDLEIKGQGGRLGPQPGRGGVNIKGNKHIFDDISGYFNDKQILKEKLGLSESNPSLIDLLYNTGALIASGADTPEIFKNYTVNETIGQVFNLYVNSVISRILKPAYGHAFTKGGKSENCEQRVRDAFNGILTGQTTPVNLKHTITYASVVHYVDNPKHTYQFLLFIDKKSLKFAVLLRKDLESHINAGKLGADVDTARGGNSGAGGFKMDTLFPNMMYYFSL